MMDNQVAVFEALEAAIRRKLEQPQHIEETVAIGELLTKADWDEKLELIQEYSNRIGITEYVGNSIYNLEDGIPVRVYAEILYDTIWDIAKKRTE